MSNKIAVYVVFALVIVATILNGDVDARYLPARGSPERLEKLRELLKEVSKLYKVFFLKAECFELFIF